MLACACNRNIKESSLLFGVASIVTYRRKESLFETGDKYRIEFTQVKSASDAVPLSDAQGLPQAPLTFW